MSARHRPGMSPGMLVLAVAAGCATVPVRPAWVDRPASRYPEAEYLAAVGRGGDLESARAAARGEIASIITVRISQQETHRAQETTIGAASHFSRQSDVETRASTDLVLEGTQVPETWTGKDGTVYALAVLNRREAADRLLQRLAGLDREIQSRLAEAATAASPLGAVRASVGALRAAEEADRAAQPLSELARRTEPHRAPGVRAGLEEKLQKMGIVVHPAGSDPEPARQAAVEALGKLGVTVVESPGGYVLNADITLLPADRGDPKWRYLTWKARAELLEEGRVVGAGARSGQAAHLTEAEARSRAIQAARGGLGDAVREAFLGR